MYVYNDVSFAEHVTYLRYDTPLTCTIFMCYVSFKIKFACIKMVT